MPIHIMPTFRCGSDRYCAQCSQLWSFWAPWQIKIMVFSHFLGTVSSGFGIIDKVFFGTGYICMKNRYWKMGLAVRRARRPKQLMHFHSNECQNDIDIYHQILISTDPVSQIMKLKVPFPQLSVLYVIQRSWVRFLLG